MYTCILVFSRAILNLKFAESEKLKPVCEVVNASWRIHVAVVINFRCQSTCNYVERY